MSGTYNSVQDDDQEYSKAESPIGRTQIDPQIPRSKSMLLNKVNRHSHQGEHDPESWLKHKCHVIVLTYSGKPVYTRYGGEDMIAGFTGTLQALVSKFGVMGLSAPQIVEQLQSISYGDLRMVFVDRSPLLLVGISKHANGSISSMERLLRSVHAQLIFVLTNGVNHTLEQRPNFDVRSLLGGTKPIIGNLVSWMNNQMFSCIQGVAVETLPLPFTSRSALSRIVQTGIPDCCLYSVLLCGHRVVCTASSQFEGPHVISASDLVLLINVVCSSSNSLLKSGQGECWTPVCLPNLSGDAFVYSYIQYMTADVSLVSICVDPDNENFYKLSEHGRLVKETLEFSQEIAAILEWSQKCPLSVSDFFSSTNVGSESFDQMLLNVKHCAIVLNGSRQIFSSSCQDKEIFRTYSQCMSLLGDSNEDSQQISMTTKEDFVFVWTTSEFQLFITAPRGIDISVITRVYQWLRENEQTLFISNVSLTNEPGTRLAVNPSSLW